MPAPDIPPEYQHPGAAQARYIEGWQDAQAGKPHTNAPVAHPNEFVRQQEQALHDAYLAGYTAGSKADKLETDILARANALLDELGDTEPETLHIGKLTDLAIRLHLMADALDQYIEARLSNAGDGDLNRLTDELDE